jgi:hypothetical protein
MEVRTMPRTPLQQFGDLVGMYAYLAAVGGLRYWPALRRASIVEETLPAEPEQVVQHEAPQAEEIFSDSVRHEYSSSRERTPAA